MNTSDKQESNPYSVELDKEYEINVVFEGEQSSDVKARKKIFASSKEKLNSIFKNAHALSLKRK